jgi:hypothetical protein
MTPNRPWWVESVYKFGVPTAIAVYLVWFLAQKVQLNLEAVQTSLVHHIQTQEQNNKYSEKSLQILRVICAQGARNVTERNACFE